MRYDCYIVCDIIKLMVGGRWPVYVAFNHVLPVDEICKTYILCSEHKIKVVLVFVCSFSLFSRGRYKYLVTELKGSVYSIVV